MLTITCPGCNAGTNVDPDDPPRDRQGAMVCTYCGFLGIWEAGTGWRNPSVEERAGLLRDEDVLRAMEWTVLTRGWRERDHAGIEEVTTAVLCKYNVNPALRPYIANAVAQTLIKAGFHTHPEDTRDE